MTELAIAAIIVAFAYTWRIGHDVGRRSAQRVTIDLGGKALLIDRKAFGSLRSSLRPPKLSHRVADDDYYRPYLEFGMPRR